MRRPGSASPIGSRPRQPVSRNAPSARRTARKHTGMRSHLRDLKPGKANVGQPINSIGSLTSPVRERYSKWKRLPNVTRKVRPNVRNYPYRRCATEPAVAAKHRRLADLHAESPGDRQEIEQRVRQSDVGLHLAVTH